MEETFKENRPYATILLAAVNLAVFLVLELAGSTENIRFM